MRCSCDHVERMAWWEAAESTQGKDELRAAIQVASSLRFGLAMRIARSSVSQANGIVDLARAEALHHCLEHLGDIPVSALDALAATKGLLNALEQRTYDAAHWERRRRQLLNSPARASAVEYARRTHPTQKGPHRR